VPARRRAVAAREEDLSERRGGAAWRGVARRNANFVVVEVGGEGTRWTVDEVVAWAGCAAAQRGAVRRLLLRGSVSLRLGLALAVPPSHTSGVGCGLRGGGRRRRRGVVATRIRMDAVRGGRLVVSARGGSSGWVGPALSPLPVGVGDGSGKPVARCLCS